MAEKFLYDLVSPEKLLSSGEAEMIVIPGTDGDFGVLRGHAPIISTIRPGQIEVHESASEITKFYITGGVCEVSSDRCNILADEAIPFSDLNKADLEERLSVAESKVSDAADDLQLHHATNSVSALKEVLQTLK